MRFYTTSVLEDWQEETASEYKYRSDTFQKKFGAVIRRGVNGGGSLDTYKFCAARTAR